MKHPQWRGKHPQSQTKHTQSRGKHPAPHSGHPAPLGNAEKSWATLLLCGVKAVHALLTRDLARTNVEPFADKLHIVNIDGRPAGLKALERRVRESHTSRESRFISVGLVALQNRNEPLLPLLFHARK